MFEKANFEVVTQPLVTTEGIRTDKKAVIRTDTKQVLGVVGTDYNLVRHEEVLNRFQDALKDDITPSGLHLCRAGSLMFAKYIFKETIIPKEEIKKGDIVSFGLEIFNSYDGSLPVGFMLTALRLICTNGMTIPKSVVRLAIRHTVNARINEMRDLVLSKILKFKESLHLWRQWSETKITEENSIKFIQETFGKRQSKVIEEVYRTKKEDDTLWGLYNSLTYYQSHLIKTRKGNEENIRLNQWAFDEKVMDRFYNQFGK